MQDVGNLLFMAQKAPHGLGERLLTSDLRCFRILNVQQAVSDSIACSLEPDKHLLHIWLAYCLASRFWLSSCPVVTGSH